MVYEKGLRNKNYYAKVITVPNSILLCAEMDLQKRYFLY